MKISTAAKEYLIEIEVRKFTPKTIRSYRNNLNLFLRFCEEQAHVTDVEDLSLAVVRQFSLYMSSRGKKGSYINGLLKVAKAFIQYCYDEGYGGFNTKKNFRWCKQDKAVIMAFKPSDVRQMLKLCRGGDYIHIRDTAVLTMLFETGIRCWELCCIQKKDIHDDFIIINGKNHKHFGNFTWGSVIYNLLLFNCLDTSSVFKVREKKTKFQPYLFPFFLEVINPFNWF